MSGKTEKSYPKFRDCRNLKPISPREIQIIGLTAKNSVSQTMQIVTIAIRPILKKVSSLIRFFILFNLWLRRYFRIILVPKISFRLLKSLQLTYLNPIAIPFFTIEIPDTRFLYY